MCFLCCLLCIDFLFRRSPWINLVESRGQLCKTISFVEPVSLKGLAQEIQYV